MRSQTVLLAVLYLLRGVLGRLHLRLSGSLGTGLAISHARRGAYAARCSVQADHGCAVGMHESLLDGRDP